MAVAVLPAHANSEIQGVKSGRMAFLCVHPTFPSCRTCTGRGLFLRPGQTMTTSTSSSSAPSPLLSAGYSAALTPLGVVSFFSVIHLLPSSPPPRVALPPGPFFAPSLPLFTCIGIGVAAIHALGSHCSCRRCFSLALVARARACAVTGSSAAFSSLRSHTSRGLDMTWLASALPIIGGGAPPLKLLIREWIGREWVLRMHSFCLERSCESELHAGVQNCGVWHFSTFLSISSRRSLAAPCCFHSSFSPLFLSFRSQVAYGLVLSYSIVDSLLVCLFLTSLHFLRCPCPSVLRRFFFPTHLTPYVSFTFIHTSDCVYNMTWLASALPIIGGGAPPLKLLIRCGSEGKAEGRRWRGRRGGGMYRG